MNKHRALTFVFFLSAGCGAAAAPSSAPPVAQGRRGSVVRAAQASDATDWTAEERSRPVALRNLRRSPEASHHLLRLNGAASAHVHEKSDLLLLTVAGALTLSVGGQQLSLAPGDVVEIPRGTPYEMRRQGDASSVLYLVCTPALASDDFRPAEETPTGESVWKWNLWLQ